MVNRIHIALVALTALMTAASAGAVYVGKKGAEHDAQAIRELTTRIANERQRISELRAEWSALDHPVRLQELVARHNDVLELETIAPEQVLSVAAAVSAARRKQAEDEK